MAHAAEKIRFGSVGLFRQVRGLLELDVFFLQDLIQPFARTDIGVDADEVGQLPLMVQYG